MKKRMYGIIVIVACIALIVWGLWSVISLVIIRYAGYEVVGTVIELPSECDKYNSIKILINDKQYEVSISREDCNKSVYKIGQQVELLKHDNYQELVWPESHPELVIIIIIGVLIFGYFTIRKYYRK